MKPSGKPPGTPSGKPSGLAGSICTILALTSCLESSPASAHSERMWGETGAQYLPQAVEWSLSDLATPDQTKVEVVDRDDGDAGWRLEGVAVRSYDPLSLALPAKLIDDHDTDRFRTRHFSASAWHALGDHDTLRFTAVAGRTSRRTDDSVVLPAKTLTGFAGAQLAWEHARTWSFSIGAFRQGGWGGRSLERDLLHFSNGEPPAARGLKASWRMKLQGNESDSAGSGIWVGLDSRLGTRAAGLGGALAQSAHHESRLGLVLASRF